MEKKWCFVKYLDKGAFGEVYLYKNKETEESLVIKKIALRKDKDMAKQLSSLKIECETLLTFEHRNVVRTKEVPSELRDAGQPSVAMEYCSMGNLRQVLQKPENKYGLSEVEVRSIVRDVFDGIEYIHSKSLWHRDIKPENILLSCELPGKITHKLCDFGLASVDADSSIQSGTPHYMAPEIIKSPPYDKKVDYWSFGVVVFECITGRRPFNLEHGGGARFVAHVNQIETKKSLHIWGEFGNSEPTFYHSLPPGHQLNRSLQRYVEQWLRLVLECDPKKRGGKIDSNTDRLMCFSHLEQIIKLKFVKFFLPSTLTWLSYPVHEDSSTMSMATEVGVFVNMMEKEMKGETGGYILLSSHGVVINRMEPVSSYAHSYDEREDERIIHVVTRDISGGPLTSIVLQVANELQQLMAYRQHNLDLEHVRRLMRKLSTSLAALMKSQKAANLWISRPAEQITFATDALCDIHQSCISHQISFEDRRTMIDEFHSAQQATNESQITKVNQILKHIEECHQLWMAAYQQICYYFRCALEVQSQIDRLPRSEVDHAVQPQPEYRGSQYETGSHSIRLDSIAMQDCQPDAWQPSESSSLIMFDRSSIAS